MPTHSPLEGLSGLQESGEASNAPQRNAAQAESLSKRVARLATGVARKVGPLMTAATLTAASAGCNDNNSSASATATVNSASAPAPTPAPTPSATPAPTPTVAPSPAPTPAPVANPFDTVKLVCKNMGLVNDGSRLAAENYRRMVVDTEWGLYEPCADSSLPNETGRFVMADCSQTDQHKTCVLKDSYTDNDGNKVNTETTFKWLTRGYNRVESPQSVGFVFPLGLYARNGVNIDKVDPNKVVAYGSRNVVNKEKPATPSPVTPTPGPAPTTKKIHPRYDSSRDDLQDAQIRALQAEAAQNRAKDNEQDARLDNHDNVINILIRNGHATTPHPTPADYDSLGRSRATK